MDILPHRVPLFRLRGRYMAENRILASQWNSGLPAESRRPIEHLGRVKIFSHFSLQALA